MPRKDKVIHISNLPSTFRGNITRNERFIQTPRSNGKKFPQKQYAVGGKIPNVVAGGIAQPLGNNFFYMNGRKHSQGGIDIGPSDKTGVEVEDGEVVETNGNELKVYSAQPIINGVSPAKLVMGGANPDKVFKAQEDFKDRNGINDDGTKAKYGKEKYVVKSDNTRVTPIMESPRNSGIKQEDFIYYPETYRIANNTLEKVPARKEVNMTPLEQVNPEFDILLSGAGVLRYVDKATKVGIIDKIPEDEVKALYYNNVNNKLGKLLSKNYRKYVEKQFNKQYRKAINKEIAKNGITDDELKEYIESKGIHPEHKKYNVITSEKLVKSSRNKGIPYTRDHFGKYTKGYSRKSRKFGGKNMIVSISGNVKNGLIHSPSSTGGRHDKFAVGGNRINRHGRTWEYDEQNGYYVPITNRTINRTSAYPINKSARGETIIGSDYTFRNGRWSKNNNVNTNTNKPNIDNGNRRPQYYAERELPLFDDGPAITSGLVRAGWSHGNNKGISTNNTNIPSLSETKSSGKTPRGGRSKSSQSTQSIPTKTPPTAVYNRNLPKVEASIPTTLPISTNIPAKGTTSSDGKGQGKFKNLTTADWIGLGSNVAGSLASYFASRRAINKMKGPGQPTLISANKLKTKYNINPQLDRIREDKFEAYRDIDSNTASSRVSLARKQRVRNAAGQAANELYGNKENIETNLINQDRRNQQSVRQFNAQQYNQYIDRKTAFDNGIREAKVTNINNLFSGINAGIQDMISRYENRKALNNTIGAMRASAPNVDDRIMRDAGVDYDEFIIRKRRKLGGKQSCR